MKTKAFDCIRMKDESQQRRASKLAGLSRDERLAYYARAHQALVMRQGRLRSGRSADTAEESAPN